MTNEGFIQFIQVALTVSVPFVGIVLLYGDHFKKEYKPKVEEVRNNRYSAACSDLVALMMETMRISMSVLDQGEIDENDPPDAIMTRVLIDDVNKKRDLRDISEKLTSAEEPKQLFRDYKSFINRITLALFISIIFLFFDLAVLDKVVNVNLDILVVINIILLIAWMGMGLDILNGYVYKKNLDKIIEEECDFL